MGLNIVNAQELKKIVRKKIRNALIVLIDASFLLGGTGCGVCGGGVENESGMSLFQKTFVLIQPPNWKSINYLFP